MKKPSSGWFKLLGQQEGEFYNVQIVEDEEVAKLSAELEVSAWPRVDRIHLSS